MATACRIVAGVHVVEQHRVGEAHRRAPHAADRAYRPRSRSSPGGRRPPWRRSSTARMPPATAMWLSLIRIASSSPKPMVECAAAAHRVFLQRAQARRRSCAMQQTRARVCAMRRTNSAAADAMPERWPTKLSAVRSAASSARASPPIVMIVVLAATAARRRRTLPVISAVRIEPAEDRGRDRQPGDHAGLARRHHGTAARALRNGRNRGEVAGPAEIFGKRAHDGLASIASGERNASGQRRGTWIFARYLLGGPALHSPLVGEGWGRGVARSRAPHRHIARPPPPTPPHKGEGERKRQLFK